MTEGTTELSLDYKEKEWQKLNDAEKKYLDEIQNDLKNNNWKQEFQQQNKDGWSQAWDLTHLQEIGLLDKDWQLSYENIYENKNLTQANRALLISITQKAELYIRKEVYKWEYVRDNELLSDVLDKDWIKKYILSTYQFSQVYFNDAWTIEVVWLGGYNKNLEIKGKEININNKLTFGDLRNSLKWYSTSNLGFSKEDAWNNFVNDKYVKINWRQFPNPNINLYGDEWNESSLTSLTDTNVDTWFDLWANFFDYNNSEVKDEIKTVFTDKKIAQIKSYLQNNPNEKLNIDAYASEEWENDHNKTLSQNRADAVKKWLESKWISADKIVSNWKWETNKFWEWQDNYEKNRRTLISFR